MDAKAVSIYELFTGFDQKNPEYVISHYQRGYAWKREDVQTLIEDILEAQSTGSNAYFIGAITTIKKQDDSHRYEVIDGQQRITTALLIAHALLEKLPLPDPKARRDESASIHDKLRILVGYADREHPPIYHTRSDDRTAYQAVYEGNIQGRGSYRITDIFDFLLTYLEKYKSDDLERFARYFLDDTRLVIIHTDDEESSYQIFETLNNRGESLSPLDLIKNRIFRTIEKEKLIEMGLYQWEQALKWLQTSNIDSRSLDTSLQLLFAVRFGIREQRWIEPKGLYSVVKETLDGVNPKGALNLLQELLSDASIKTWVQIYRRNGAILDAKPYAAEVRAAAERKVFWPVLFVLLLAENVEGRANKARAEVIKKSARLMHNYIRRVRLAGKIPVQKLGLKMASTAHELQGMKPADWYDQIRAALLEADRETVGVFEDDAFKQAVVRKPTIDMELAKAAFVDLVNARAQSDGERLEQATNLHLEHILPQSPSFDDWPDFTPDEHANYLNRLGNLTLLGSQMNQAIQNGPFSGKVEEYKKCNYWITREIPDRYKEWTKKSIEERGGRLLDELAKIWTVE